MGVGAEKLLGGGEGLTECAGWWDGAIGSEESIPRCIGDARGIRIYCVVVCLFSETLCMEL